ncbi:MAG: ABC transporter permease [Chloroflexota bacterium]|nr:ABC transporter permease [Chloroflexota bacterium]MDE2885926.1 ABC transporter permease [Chloroflexota bacterium]
MRSKTWLVARHEFAVTTGRLGFRIFAAAVPVLALLALIGIGVFEAVRGGDEPSGSERQPAADAIRVGYVDLSVGEDGRSLFTSFQEQDGVSFAPYRDEGAGSAALQAEEIDALYVFPRDFLQTGLVVRMRMEDSDGGASTDALRRFVLSNLVAEKVGDQELERVVRPYTLATVELSESGTLVEEDGSDGAEFLFSFGAGMLLIMSVLTASGYLLQGLSEEKENRIMEVLLSSLRPEQLMFGKLLGLGAAGLLQMAAWTASLVAFLLLLGRIVDLPFELSTPSADTLVVALAYFLLGYAFFGTVQAALGVITTNQKEANNIAVFVVLPAVSPFWFSAVLFEHPDGILAQVLSLVPFTAPLTGLLRFGAGAISPAGTALSLGVLAAFTALAVLLTVRLFRAYLLMYGQRPRVGHILQTLWRG